MSFADRIDVYRNRVEAALERWLPPAMTHPARFHTAMRYSVLGGGKRLRALLVYATGEWLGLHPQRLDAIAVAIELVHAYSLVHDDLPAMDNDELRRGRASTHIAFDEATAILVGDALQAHAYAVLASDHHLEAQASARCWLVRDLASASGSDGMAGGQAMDMAVSSGTPPDAACIEDLYARKTGRLIAASLLMPCRLLPEPDETVLSCAERCGRALGLAFQIADDLLDIESATELMGKPQGSDLRNHKATLPALWGVEKTRSRLTSLQDEALQALSGAGEKAEGLRWMCELAVRRNC